MVRRRGEDKFTLFLFVFLGKILKYEDGKWKEVGRDCNLKLNKLEGQVRKRESV